MEELEIEKIEWSAPEYSHKERSNDWFWAIGVITIVAAGLAFWLSSSVFAIFILISGATLIMFTLRQPNDVSYGISTDGFTMGRDLHEWKNVKSFNIKKKKDESYFNLLIETKKYFLPIYTIPLPEEMADRVKEELLKVAPRSEINESQAMVFMERLGF